MKIINFGPLKKNSQIHTNSSSFRPFWLSSPEIMFFYNWNYKVDIIFVSVALLITVAKNWKQLNCPAVRKLLTLWSMILLGCYAAIPSNHCEVSMDTRNSENRKPYSEKI